MTNAVSRLAAAALACAALGGALLAHADEHPGPPQGTAALGALAGTWQSDTVNGVSARSQCDWTAAHGALACEQTVTTPQGRRHALDLFAFDSASGKYVFYLLLAPGDTMRPTPLGISGPIWTYGGTAPGKDGKWYRTINDFTATSAYTWRQESSADGVHWTVGQGGRSTRVH